ncbi:thioredoxin family protein [Shewanella sp. GXUN23E]|uniref:thioredoxin family protein n=1 Tax=Shewanella sp. GXUN23E TaxID=3422498 RepID=UPI003D7D62AA
MTNAVKALLATTALFFSAQSLAAGGCGFETETQGLIATCTQEEQELILTGIIEPKQLVTEDDFSEGYQSYQVDEQTLAALKAVDTPTEIVVIIGTWCPDCHRETPRFIRIMEELNNPNITARYIGVDRQKQDPEGLAAQYEFTRIPTFIVLQNGKEVGRIVERPTETLEKDLANILN